ncbi:MAG TPA: hypothetical protein VMH85_02895 [Terriglobales bacterium]|nr:hypothetical protein [Terriglobales bacterium]
MKRILIAGIVGGIVLFLWGGLSHMVVGLGEVGVQNLPQAQPVVDALRNTTPQPGFYFFPHVDRASQKMDPGAAGGPWGIVIYHPSGASQMMTGQLVNECILNIVQALLAAFLLSLAPRLRGYAWRVGFVFVLGILAAISTNVEYWNWYGFPANYTGAIMLDRLIGFLVVGLIAAALVKPAAAPMVITTPKAA